MKEVFALEDECPLAVFVVRGDGIESIVDLSLRSCEESGTVLICDFQYDSYVSVSCRFGPLAFCRTRSNWLAFLMVDCELFSTRVHFSTCLYPVRKTSTMT